MGCGIDILGLKMKVVDCIFEGLVYDFVKGAVKFIE